MCLCGFVCLHRYLAVCSACLFVWLFGSFGELVVRFVGWFACLACLVVGSLARLAGCLFGCLLICLVRVVGAFVCLIVCLVCVFGLCVLFVCLFGMTGLVQLVGVLFGWLVGVFLCLCVSVAVCLSGKSVCSVRLFGWRLG